MDPNLIGGDQKKLPRLCTFHSLKKTQTVDGMDCGMMLVTDNNMFANKVHIVGATAAIILTVPIPPDSVFKEDCNAHIVLSASKNANEQKIGECRRWWNCPLAIGDPILCDVRYASVGESRLGNDRKVWLWENAKLLIRDSVNGTYQKPQAIPFLPLYCEIHNHLQEMICKYKDSIVSDKLGQTKFHPTGMPVLKSEVKYNGGNQWPIEQVEPNSQNVRKHYIIPPKSSEALDDSKEELGDTPDGSAINDMIMAWAMEYSVDSTKMKLTTNFQFYTREKEIECNFPEPPFEEWAREEEEERQWRKKLRKERQSCHSESEEEGEEDEDEDEEWD